MAAQLGSSRSPIQITLLTRADCGFCEQAKEILARLAQAYQITVSTVDFESTEGERLALRGGVLFPPGLFVNGEPFSYGRVSERKLRRALERSYNRDPIEAHRRE